MVCTVETQCEISNWRSHQQQPNHQGLADSYLPEASDVISNSVQKSCTLRKKYDGR